MKKIIAAVLTSMFLLSAGAFAADTTKHECKAGYKWDMTKKECVRK
jgi:hypothetical protein